MGVSNEIFCCEMFHKNLAKTASILLALPTKGKDMVFRFIIEYSSFLRDFGS
jgi:hypothetical protein